jgi:hypothetical protein
MSRAQQGSVDNTATAENTSYNTQATDAFKDAQGDVGNYSNAVGQFAAANPYGTGGPVQTAQNQETADTAAGMGQSAGQALQGQAVRTGQNAGGAIAGTEAMEENNERALVGQEAGNTASTAAANAGYQGQVVADTGNVQNMQNSLATEQSGAAQGALGTEEQAAQTPSFLDSLGQGLTGLAGAGLNAAATYYNPSCPAEGSLYLMADGTEKPVEDLAVGELLSGIDGEGQVIEEIQSAMAQVLKVTTENGSISRSSRVHAFALPLGGFTVAMHAMGKTIVTTKGRSKVVSVEEDGEDVVFNVITDGSHTYRADGIWALGVGEAERHVSMEKWDEIADKLAVTNGGR